MKKATATLISMTFAVNVCFAAQSDLWIGVASLAGGVLCTTQAQGLNSKADEQRAWAKEASEKARLNWGDAQWYYDLYTVGGYDNDYWNFKLSYDLALLFQSGAFESIDESNKLTSTAARYETASYALYASGVFFLVKYFITKSHGKLAKKKRAINWAFSPISTSMKLNYSF